MNERRYPSWVRYSGVGLALAGAIAGLSLIGSWVDGRFGTGPWGIVVGVFIGLVGGLYNLVKESLAAVREAQADDESARDGASKEHGKNGE